MGIRDAAYPGSFDPITYGHVNIVKRASERFDKLYVVVVNNPNKKYLFSLQERIEMVKKDLEGIPNVIVESFDGLLVNYLKEKKIYNLIRGLRAVSDYEYELQMANANHMLFRELEIFFLMADTDFSYISSSMIKEIASYNGDVSKWVSKFVESKLQEKLLKK
ncbi:phosphopantetheine adenylyltransferase [Petrotoga mexicana DSM 14811]|jgi:pantetheine-phosphate adenylyltransferase|uniref:Phosphopantetheine adenylyltransferase n=2 Tax=Petrotoga TaxID=28236 RepID=A0A2K1P4V5_9BACT|nr:MULTISPECIES: pantetheine-phosphate adenylyltransferase [Petrotoga]MDN5345787.1 pantetheine-phosphate adenylyltransferase [Petrotoga sp.]PNR97818.1 phosphopantetheine adenylyltransferase [Petrotoga mexicana DSM 14811]PNS02533.1 phosphopantetheine adenylyltransferase [Petrotoga miotherma DSM 10691]